METDKKCAICKKSISDRELIHTQECVVCGHVEMCQTCGKELMQKAREKKHAR